MCCPTMFSRDGAKLSVVVIAPVAEALSNGTLRFVTPPITLAPPSVILKASIIGSPGSTALLPFKSRKCWIVTCSPLVRPVTFKVRALLYVLLTADGVMVMDWPRTASVERQTAEIPTLKHLQEHEKKFINTTELCMARNSKEVNPRIYS